MATRAVAYIAVAGVLAVSWTEAYAQFRTTIKTDSSWGRKPTVLAPTGGPTELQGNGSLTHTIPGQVYTIPQAQGKTVGPNLFHSFETFSIGPNDAAVFTTSSADLRNVISRVSGSAPTRIDGVLTLKAAGDSRPDFFFINPAGVTFSSYALVDVPAAFHVSSATQLNFANGVVFKAANGADSTLSVAPPASFGFVGGEGAVKLQGVNSLSLPFRERGRWFVASLIEATAPNIDINDSYLEFQTPSSSTASSPSVRFTATGSRPTNVLMHGLPTDTPSGAITFTSSTIRVDDFGAAVAEEGTQAAQPAITLSGGTISMANADIRSIRSNAQGGKGAEIDISAGQLTMSRSTLEATTSTSAPGGDINISADGDIVATGFPRIGGISTIAYSSGRAGDVTIQGKNLSLGVDIQSSGLAGGDTGSVRISALDKLSLTDIAKIDLSTNGNGGDIRVSAADIHIGGSGIYNRTRGFSTSGRAGNITISASSNLTVDYPGAFILNNGWVNDFGTIAPSVLSVDAKRLVLRGNARLSATSTSNVPSNVALLVAEQIHEGQNQIHMDGSWGRTPRAVNWTDDALLHDGEAIQIFGSNGDVRTILGKLYVISEEDGWVAGANLFHSFDRFSVGAGDAVIFTTTRSLQNVIARITGWSASAIDGLLMMSPAPGSRPNFFLINPAGITFGAGAIIDVPAAFHATTASRLIFRDGEEFAAKSPDSVASAGDPVAFRFVGGEAGIGMRYVIHGGLAASLPFFFPVSFEMTDSSPFATSYFDLTAPNIQITDSKFFSRNQPQFGLRLVGVGAAANTVPLQGAAEVHAAGKVSVANSDFGWIWDYFNHSEIRVGDSGNNGQLDTALIAIASNQESATQPNVEILGPSIHASNTTIAVDGSPTLPIDASGPQASRILLSADLVELHDTGLGGDAGVASELSGNIEIRARELLGFRMRIGSSSQFGKAPNVKLSADHIALNGGGIYADVFDASTRAGDVLVTGRNVELIDTVIGAQATNDALAPGNIKIVAARLYLDNALLSSGSGISEPAPSAGLVQPAISIIAPSVVMVNGASITSETSGRLKAARIEFMPTEDGPGNLSITGDGTGEITSSTVARPNASDGAAGDIYIRAANLTLSNIALASEAKVDTHGQAGTISLLASDTISILNDARIATDTQATGGAGNITITAGNLRVDPSEISSKASATSTGQPGSISVTARHGVTILDGSKLTIENDAHALDPSLIRRTSIEVTAPKIELLGGQINAASTDNVAASNVRVTAGDQLIMRNGAIFTTANEGNGGAIELSGGRVIALDHSQVSTSVTGRLNGNGGDIRVTAPALAMNTGFIQANTSAAQASGGNVFIDVGTLVSAGDLSLNAKTLIPFDARLEGVSVIQAAAPDGVSGDVRVAAPVLDIAGSVKTLSAQVLDIGVLGKDVCRIGARSSFTHLGRGGLRPTSSGLMRPEPAVRSAAEKPGLANGPEATSIRRQNVAQSYRCEY